MTAAELFFKGLIVVGSIVMCAFSGMRYCRDVRDFMKAKAPTA
jgi:hypothetical protein